MSESRWICVLLNKSLTKRGEEGVFDEIRRLVGDSFLDFRMAEDDFDGEQYSFVKCKDFSKCLQKFRSSVYVAGVLDSYDSPSYLTDEEVLGFVEVPEVVDPLVPRYGDIVRVCGDHDYDGLQGVVLLGEGLRSFVLFRFHTMSRELWIDCTLLVREGTVFSWWKFPVEEPSCLRKYPIISED